MHNILLTKPLIPSSENNLIFSMLKVIIHYMMYPLKNKL